MSLQDEIIDINGNKITDESILVEHCSNGDTYKTTITYSKNIIHKNILFYTRLSEDRLKVKRKYTQYTYKMKKQ